MRIFVTGAAGFLGSHLVPKLIERGHQVTCLVRDERQAARSAQRGATLAGGDITERESLRAPMTNADAVFHVAAWYQDGVKPGQGAQMYAVNVEGTRNTLGLAAEFESLTSEYERTKWMAHYEVLSA
jgi:nucleoside-diphosphate-sugar epimerase